MQAKLYSIQCKIIHTKLSTVSERIMEMKAKHDINFNLHYLHVTLSFHLIKGNNFRRTLAG